LVTAQAQPGRKPTAQHKLASFASYGTIVALAGRPGVDTPSAQQCTNRTTVGKPVRAVAVFLCQIATGADDGQRGVWTTLNRQQVGETIVALATGGDPMVLKSKRQKAKGKRQKAKSKRSTNRKEQKKTKRDVFQFSQTIIYCATVVFKMMGRPLQQRKIFSPPTWAASNNKNCTPLL
jgi:hypothetical protein